MATTKTITVQYKLRGDALANLEAKNAVYGVNEPVVVLVPADADAGTKAATLLKLGDGTTAFNDLPYVTALDSHLLRLVQKNGNRTGFPLYLPYAKICWKI